MKGRERSKNSQAGDPDATVNYSVSATAQDVGPARRRASRAEAQPESYYLLADQIAAGGMATVNVALQRGAEGFHRIVAMKRIHPHLAQQREFCEMFIDEARIAARINHPSVCRVLDFGKGEQGYFLTMEYLAGEPLSKVLRALAQRPELQESPRHPLLMARIFANLAEGLHAAHTLTTDRGEPLDVVHRDVTPQNLFVLFDGTMRVTDFGIALARQRVHQTQGDYLKGKLAYMAPEQLERRPVDARVDIWALGVVLWESLTFQRLFLCKSESETLVQVLGREVPPPSLRNPNVTPALDAVLERALSRDPAERYQTAREIARDLERCLGASSDTVPTMDVAEWMRDLFPNGAARSAQLVSSALMLSTMPPPSAGDPVEIIPANARLPTNVELDEETLRRRRAESEPATIIVEPTTALLPRPRIAERGVQSVRPKGRVTLGAIVALAATTASFGFLSQIAMPHFGGGMTAQPNRPELARAPRPASEFTVAPAPVVSAAPVTESSPPATIAPTAAAPPIVAPPLAAPPDARETLGATASAASVGKIAPAPSPARAPASRQEVDERADAARAQAEATRAGSIYVAATNGQGEIFENGKLLGRTPARLALPPGRHSLTVRPVGGGPERTLTVNVTPGGFGMVTVALPPPAPASSAPH